MGPVRIDIIIPVRSLYRMRAILRMNPIIKTSTILLIATGLLMTLPMCSTRQFDSLDQKMEYLVSGLVGKDRSIRNCVLSVVKGDGSFSWSGAAGIARSARSAISR